MSKLTDIIAGSWEKREFFYCPRCNDRLNRYATYVCSEDMAFITCHECKVVWKWRVGDLEVITIDKKPVRASSPP